MAKDYIKFECKGRDDALHCHYFHWGRSGVGCPCIAKAAKDIPAGTLFTVEDDGRYTVDGETQGRCGQ